MCVALKLSHERFLRAYSACRFEGLFPTDVRRNIAASHGISW